MRFPSQCELDIILLRGAGSIAWRTRPTGKRSLGELESHWAFRCSDQYAFTLPMSETLLVFRQVSHEGRDVHSIDRRSDT